MNHAASTTPPVLSTPAAPNSTLTVEEASNRPASEANTRVDSPVPESGGAKVNAPSTQAEGSVRVLRSTEDIMACLQALRAKKTPLTTVPVPADAVVQRNDKTDTSRVETEHVEPGATSMDSAMPDSGKTPSTPPEYWSAKDKEVFSTLPAGLQASITRHDQTVKAEAEKLKKHQQAYEALHLESAHSLAPLVQAAHAALLGDLARVDWAALQSRNPQEYNRLRHECDQRLAVIEAIRHQGQARFAEAKQVEAANEQARLQAHIRKEFDQVVPTIKQLMGDAYTHDFKYAVTTYLTQQDVPESALSQITNGYELKLIVKAMLYDKLMATRDQAAAKVAGAPQVQHAKGRPVASDGDARERFHKARAALSQNPRSTDLIVQMLRASRG